MTGQRDAGTLVKITSDAIRDADFQAAETAIRTLAVTDPGAARDVLDTIQAGLMISEMTP